MGRLRTFTRRAFIVGSVAVAGGVAFGTYQVMRTPQNPLKPGGDAVALNPWLIIDQSGITIITPRAEMGQGVHTTLAALVAEELDVDLADVATHHGPPAQAYYNGALMADRHYSASHEQPSGLGAVMSEAFPKILSLQVTGGSTTIVDAFDKMRNAGAAARQTLLMAAADRLNTGLDRLKTDNGAVIAPDGTRIPYADLAEAAAEIAPPKSPRLKPRAEWRILGKSQPRLDQPGKATGTATFGMDVREKDMLFASVRMTPRFGGGMNSFDASAAEKMPGVEKIVDLGDGVAVIASNTWLAMQAVNAIDVTWGDAPYPSENEEIFDKIAEAFDTDPNVSLRDQGDMAALSGDVIEAEYRVPYLAHATMEPMNSTARFTGDALEIWSPNQAPVMVQSDCAKAVGLKGNAVTVHTTLMGGGFGRRSATDFAVLAARVAKEMPGRVVQTTWTREEDMTHDVFRPAAIARMQAKLADGKPVALEGRIASPSIMAQMMQQMTGMNMAPADQTLTEGAHDQPYAIENMRITGHSADVSIPVGFWRSVGNSQNAFFHESFIDELAHAAGADPMAFRVELIRPEHAGSAKVLETVRDMCGWTGKTPEGVGRGVAFTYSFGTPCAQVIELREEDGLIRISDMWIAADLGVALDPANAEAQLTGGAVFGLSAAVHGQVTFSDGMAEQMNFPDYDAMRMLNTPKFHVEILENALKIGGVGEPGTPPAAPALANALFDLTGERARRLPLGDQFDFLT
ncbi:molybdopterin cofactor-binding domain-containing protein [Aliiroseovarius subalbicans]|uniref:xanthine dehydrogenase family protein molybdopterin-binding subunit n=1 Tax=Aliiroseovarius subalbicans TaxID=2925840 RepID=UPI001F5A4BD3|nr:molybdopterin cofactor-binding domain-containing protein [Aliiroseovarius subalbicans]MCI2398064.1 molybdopterin-dependent oxidoreductase [Aliiroseovarius subalbicans]